MFLWRSDLRFTALLVLVLISLTGCLFSGGGGGGSSNYSPPAMIGQFADMRIENLRYQTRYFSGNTDNGQFQYADGETVDFSVGSILIGSLVGKPDVSFLNFDDAIPDDTLVPNDKVTNILRFLQTIGGSGFANGSISISQNTHSAAEGKYINFEQTIEAFENDQNVIDTVLALFQANGNNRTLIALNRSLVTYTEEYLKRDAAKVISEFAVAIDWQDLLNPANGLQYTYQRSLEDEAGVSNDVVSNYFINTRRDKKEMTIQSWSNNWRMDVFNYYNQPSVGGQIYFIGQQSAENQDVIFGWAIPLYLPHYAEDKWVFKLSDLDGVILPAKMRIERLTDFVVSTNYYPEAVKEIIQYYDGTITENWFVPNAGMVKQVVTRTDSIETLILESTVRTTDFPRHPVIDKFLSTSIIDKYVDDNTDDSLKNIRDGELALLALMNLFGDVKSQDHIDSFHAIYLVIISDLAVGIGNKVIEVSAQYELDEREVIHIINQSYIQLLLTVDLLAEISRIADTQQRDTTEANLITIYQGLFDLLQAAGVLQNPQLVNDLNGVL